MWLVEQEEEEDGMVVGWSAHTVGGAVCERVATWLGEEMRSTAREGFQCGAM